VFGPLPYTPSVTTEPLIPAAAEPDPAELANTDTESGSHTAVPVPIPDDAEASETEAGPGRIDSFLRRFIAGGAGLALVVGFFLDWQQATAINAESYTGFQLVLKDTFDAGQRAAMWAVPAFGVVLIGLGYLGRKPALLGSLLVGLSLLLVGTWQTLAYLAQSIGPGLWITAGAAFVALLGGIPWQRVIRGVRNG
jgi:hypothetical protein